MKVLSIAVTLALIATPMIASGEEARLSFAGDEFAAGQNASIAAAVAHDAFIAGYDVSISAPVTGDGHLAGFNVRTSAPVTGDVYAAGFSVNIGSDVGGDVTAMGNSITTQGGAVSGNARLVGQTVTLGSAVAGGALVTAQTFNLNSTVGGDLTFLGETLTFGPGARVGGTVHIQAPKAIEVPASVAAADRVSFTELVRPDYVGEAGRTAENVVRGFWPIVMGTLIWLAVLVVVGAALIALAPRLREAMETHAGARPLRTFWVGILTFASTLGLVPVAAITVIGLFVLPFVLLYVAAASVLAYLAGTYLLGIRIAAAFTAVDTNAKRLVTLVVALVAAVVVGLAPFIGWLLTLALLSYGFGAFALATIARWQRRDAERLRLAGEASTATPATN